jgi:predicted DNA-binding transcriptional regulator YafY
MATDKKVEKERSVEERLKALFQLQTLLSEIDRIKTLRGELPNEVKDLEDEIIRFQTRIQKHKDEIAELESIKNRITPENEKDVLESVITKLRALSKKDAAQIDDAIEILLKTEGAAVTQKPSYKIDVKILDTIRQAIKGNLRIKCKYDGRDKILSPYGIIYGANVFLIGVENDKPNPYVYRMHRLTDLELTEETFDKGDFDIKEYANRSFGVYQNEIIKVELLFSEDVAEDVLNFNFHPTQKVKHNEDGTVTVKFKASGEL